jgi:hypothetical protein
MYTEVNFEKTSHSSFLLFRIIPQKIDCLVSLFLILQAKYD